MKVTDGELGYTALIEERDSESLRLDFDLKKGTFDVLWTTDLEADEALDKFSIIRRNTGGFLAIYGEPEMCCSGVELELEIKARRPDVEYFRVDIEPNLANLAEAVWRRQRSSPHNEIGILEGQGISRQTLLAYIGATATPEIEAALPQTFRDIARYIQNIP